MTLREMFRYKPWRLIFATIFVLWPGPAALICGERVSSAFTKLGAGYLTNVMGAVLIAGGLCTLIGMKRRLHLLETGGLVGMAMGCALYSIGVLLGLGAGGMVAGPLGLAAALSMLASATGIVGEAREVAETQELTP